MDTGRRFISVSRAGPILYWDCPGKCGEYHQATMPVQRPVRYICTCGFKYDILMVTNITSGTARLLLEILKQ